MNINKNINLIFYLFFMIVVTGTNKGIGFNVVKHLSLLNYPIIMTSRNISLGEKA